MNFLPQTSRCGTTNLGASIREGIYETENVKFSLCLRYKLGIKEIPEKWSKIRRWIKMIVDL